MCDDGLLLIILLLRITNQTDENGKDHQNILHFMNLKASVLKILQIRSTEADPLHANFTELQSICFQFLQKVSRTNFGLIPASIAEGIPSIKMSFGKTETYL
jgi:hypothetical protein